MKWTLMLATLPWVGAAVAAKLGMTLVAGYPGVVEFGDVGLVLSGGVFLLGFMLAGTMSDFKEAEKLPGEVACTLETLEETLVQATVGHAELDPAALRKSLLRTVDATLGWLYRKVPQEDLFGRVSALADEARRLERAGATSYAGRALAEVHSLRKVVTRMGVISRTGFIAAGYALLETMAAAIFGVLLISRFKSVLAEGLLVGFVSLIFVYMIKLIRDIDDPFEYSDTGELEGAAEVELFPIVEYRARLAARIDAPVERTAPRGAGAGRGPSREEDDDAVEADGAAEGVSVGAEADGG